MIKYLYSILCECFSYNVSPVNICVVADQEVFGYRTELLQLFECSFILKAEVVLNAAVSLMLVPSAT